MKKWQKERNYRRVKDENGTVITNIITVDGINVEVTDEVFRAYSQADRKERYQAEEVADGKLLSLERMDMDKIHMEWVGVAPAPSAEEICVSNEDEHTWTQLKEMLPQMLATLDADEQELVKALFFDRMSTRAYAKQLGIYQRAVIYRRDKILKKLREKLFQKKG